MYSPSELPECSLCTFLLRFVLHLHDIIYGYAFENTCALLNHLEDLAAHIALYDDLLLALSVLRDRCTSGELLRKLLCGLLQIDA